MPLLRRTRATLRSAEFGFFGVVVYTRVQTPRFCGFAWSAGALFFFSTSARPFRTSWLIVGIARFSPVLKPVNPQTRGPIDKNAGTSPSGVPARPDRGWTLATQQRSGQ